MAGAGFTVIKKRIKSIKNTKKITRAMGLVATSKLRKSKVQLTINKSYYDTFNNLMKDIKNSYEEDSKYIKGNGSESKLYIVLTSDVGLCGGFNVNLLTSVVKVMESEQDKSVVITVGKKGKQYFNRLQYESAAEYVEVPDFPSIKEANTIAKKALYMFEKEEIGEINIAYTEFVSSVKRDVKIEKILPFEIQKEERKKEFIEYEPDVETIFENIVGLYLGQKILHCMIQSKTSEQSARMEAMDGATKNADELLEKLHLKYNRLRQSVITQEISEIVGGAEAQR